MASTFSVVSSTNIERSRVYISVHGVMASASFVDDHIAIMDATGAPWNFDRVLDLTDCIGHVEYDDFIRLSNYWAPLLRRASRLLKTAIVTQNQRSESRMPLVDKILQGQIVRTFRSVADAEAWLDEDDTPSP